MAILRLRGSLDTMPDETKDKIIAPKISSLVAPTAPDISKERRSVLNAFIWNFHLSLALSNKKRQLVFNIIRKAQDAFDEYCSAVGSLGDHVQAQGRSVSHYFSAMRHFEHCLAHLYQAVRCLNVLSKSGHGERQFDRGDNSILERIHKIHSAIKHMDSRFENGNLSDKSSFELFATKKDGTVFSVGDITNVPMWLTNDGLECSAASVTYVEIAKEIRELYRDAEGLATIVPGEKTSKK